MDEMQHTGFPRRQRRDGAPARRFDLSPLHHPLWWAALAVLLINDNLLKGAGVVPPWLTGKLSDFAFLVVAPVLLSCRLPCRLRFRRAIAFATIAALFVATDLSPAASDALVALAARVGLQWRLWPDVSDLMALVTLPVAWRTAQGQQPASPVQRRMLEPAAIIVGALACLATSAPPRFQHFPFLANRTAQAQTVTLTWLLGKVDCQVDLAQLAATLNSNDLDNPNTVTLIPGQVAALDGPPSPQAALAGVCQNTKSSVNGADCTAVVVSSPGGPSVLVSSPRSWWEDGGGAFLACQNPPDPVSTCAPIVSTSRDPGPDALTLSVVAGQLVFRAGSKLRMVTVDLAEVLSRPPDPSGCRALPDGIRAFLGAAAACTVDSDCAIVNVDIPLLDGGICNVYVNRAFSAANLMDQKDRLLRSCQTDSQYTCSSAGPVHPPVCNAGKCSELCPGREVPYCPGPCSSQGLSPDKPCAGAEGVTCQLPDGRQCVCNGLSMVTCTVPAMAAPACPVACFATYNYPIPLDSLGATSSDAAIIDAGIDASDEPNRGGDDADADVIPDTAEDRSANDAHDDQ